MKRFALAAVLGLALTGSASAQSFVDNYTYADQYGNYYQQNNYYGGYSGFGYGFVTPYSNFQGYYNGYSYRPGLNINPQTGWIQQRYPAGATWRQPNYLPPHLNRKIR